MKLAAICFSNSKTTVVATQTAEGKPPGNRYLHVHESEVDPFLLHELPVTSLLHDDAVLKPRDDVCISDRRQSVSDHNGGSPFSSLKGETDKFVIHWDYGANPVNQRAQTSLG